MLLLKVLLVVVGRFGWTFFVVVVVVVDDVVVTDDRDIGDGFGDVRWWADECFERSE